MPPPQPPAPDHWDLSPTFLQCIALVLLWTIIVAFLIKILKRWRTKGQGMVTGLGEEVRRFADWVDGYRLEDLETE
ncbi:hypothetical protein K458DRAFT_412280 [Lentithecium fluviatile CBS 122367]|uniref:Uncharacterized protein n=1 Tax=Lentithecium fluviatile CBS 122367 TaxID=1168545 RepID=A0A6G1JK84_9PLEO|nr:hypothetical protein K458DRAFT_412280 [Lentithecium fluviatile CBS 122367]